jgi:hypothetical protein
MLWVGGWRDGDRKGDGKAGVRDDRSVELVKSSGGRLASNSAGCAAAQPEEGSGEA